MRVDLRVIEGEYLQDLLDQPEALEDTLDPLDVSQPILDLAQRLQSGFFQRIVLTGMGSSFHALHPLNLQLIDYGFTAIMVETSELIHYETRLLDPKTLLIAVSQSGQSAEMVRLAEVNGNRSAIIAVSNTPESILAKQVGGNVAGNCDNRNRITVSVSDAGHEVRGSGTRGRQTNAHFPGSACEPFGSMDRTLFVLDADAADPAVLQCVENLQVRATRIAKQHVDTFKS